jgi:membrane protein DedA with SNARE-associated domain
MLQTEPQILVDYGYAGLLLLLVLGIVGVPVPDETLIMAGGFLVRRGDLHAVPTFAAAFIGSMCGITLSYVIGRTLGYSVLHRARSWLRLTEDKLAQFERWYGRMGRWVLVVGYFVPGLRHLVAIGAGASRLPWRTFAFFSYAGALLWVTTFFTMGYIFGEEWEHSSARVRIVIVAVGVALLVLGVIIALVRHRRRRRVPLGPPLG